MSETSVVAKDEIVDASDEFSSNASTNMVTNKNDDISTTKPMENFNSRDTKILSFPTDFDHMYASMADGMASPKEKNECKHLKEICLHHLDLIQQQSEIITKQEKQIQTLRQENDMLKLRMSRMDRRVVLLKPGNEVDSADADTTSTRSPSRSTVRSPTSPRSSDHLKHPCSFNLDDFEMVCHSPGQWEERAQQLHSEDGAASMSSGCELRDDSSSTTLSQRSARHAANASVTRTGRKPRTKRTISTCSKENSASRPASSTTDGPPTKKVKKIKKSCENTVGTSSNSVPPATLILTTTQHYYTAMGDTESSWGLKEEPKSEEEVNGSSDVLEIPQWRLKTYSSLYSMEGTENLDDEVFHKRHQRLEIDERRRKRWDVQRIREQRHVEKLRQRELATNNALGGPSGTDGIEEDPICSLWPSLDEAEFLEVTDELPVAAFGLPVTKFEPSEFSLPWLQAGGRRQSRCVVAKQVQVRRRRSAPGSTMQRKRNVRRGQRSSLHLAGRKSDAVERK